MNTYIVNACDWFEKPENMYVVVQAENKDKAIEKVYTIYPHRKVECTGPVNETTFFVLQWEEHA